MRFAFILIICLLPRIVGTENSWYAGFPNKRPFTVYTTRFQCTADPKYAVIDVCKLKLHRNRSSTLSFRGTILVPLDPVYGTIKIWYKTNVNIWRPLLGIDGFANTCQFFSAKDQELPVMQRLYRRTLKQMMPNAPLKCPMLVRAYNDTVN